jgi:hypothetical protein
MSESKKNKSLKTVKKKTKNSSLSLDLPKNNLTNTTAVTASLSDEADNELNAIEKINIDRLLSQAQYRYKNDSVIADKKEKLKEVTNLGVIIEEYLSCFTLIGYTFQGEKVCIFNAKTSKDEAALVDLLRATFLEIINNRP